MVTHDESEHDRRKSITMQLSTHLVATLDTRQRGTKLMNLLPPPLEVSEIPELTSNASNIGVYIELYRGYSGRRPVVAREKIGERRGPALGLNSFLCNLFIVYQLSRLNSVGTLLPRSPHRPSVQTTHLIQVDV